eukprot:356675-Chlamydomonas_euryale.AAC.7
MQKPSTPLKGQAWLQSCDAADAEVAGVAVVAGAGAALQNRDLYRTGGILTPPPATGVPCWVFAIVDAHHGWLWTARSGAFFVTAPGPLFDPLCLAALNTGTPFM